MALPPAEAFTYRSYRPRLPRAAAILPYLEEIDGNGWYTNFGPLVQRFEGRLAAHYGLPREHVVTVANCTLGLTLALMSCEAAPGSLCALPSWTFAATAAAVRQAGLVPWFLDVDPRSWQMTPEIVEAALPAAPGEVAAVMPVAPFGDALDAGWAAFRERHGLPVLTDAAAGFASVTPAEAPAVVSLHATKPLGIGEGGFVLCESAAQAESIRRRSNFGFDRRHAAVWAGSNAKLSEYAAAVGLAALDDWPEVLGAFERLSETYRAALQSALQSADQSAEQSAGGGFELSPPFARRTVSSTCNLLLERPQAEAVAARLRAQGVEARRWWGGGCHAQPAYARAPRGDLPVTEDLARRALALPYHPALTQGEIESIVGHLRSALAAQGG